ncbi:MAG: DUF4019 domain-containing protein [Syntrophobacteraceae bacterium]
MVRRAVAHDRRWEVIAAFVFGCVFITVILIIALFKPNPTPFEYTVFRIIIALAAAGVGAILPGFMQVRFKNWLRAGGALALFIVVYFFAPVPIPDPGPGTEPRSDPKVQSDAWVSLVDGGLYKDAYVSMAEGFKNKYPFAQFEELIDRESNSLGKVKVREFFSTNAFVSPPGAPKGHYRQYGYRTSFEREARTIYEMVWLVGEDEQWRVSGFAKMVKSDSGQFVPYEPN